MLKKGRSGSHRLVYRCSACCCVALAEPSTLRREAERVEGPLTLTGPSTPPPRKGSPVTTTPNHPGCRRSAHVDCLEGYEITSERFSTGCSWSRRSRLRGTG